MLSFSFLRVNFQFTLLRPRIMQDGAPLITLVKKGELAERPSLSSEDLALEQTLSMLCSFLSVDDFVSFLNSLPSRPTPNEKNIGWCLKLGSITTTPKPCNSILGPVD